MTEETELLEDEVNLSEIDPPAIDSKYRRIILAAQRSKQLQRGALPRVDVDPRKIKPTRIALKEFEERKINFSFTDQDEEAAA